jgi:hypothetical protein
VQQTAAVTETGAATCTREQPSVDAFAIGGLGAGVVATTPAQP